MIFDRLDDSSNPRHGPDIGTSRGRSGRPGGADRARDRSATSPFGFAPEPLGAEGAELRAFALDGLRTFGVITVFVALGVAWAIVETGIVHASTLPGALDGGITSPLERSAIGSIAPEDAEPASDYSLPVTTTPQGDHTDDDRLGECDGECVAGPGGRR